MLLAGRERLVHVEPLDAAARAAADAVLLHGEHDGRLVELVDEPRCRDADDAGVPALARDDDGLFLRHVEGFKLLLRRLADRALNLAPLCVEQVELECELVGLRSVLRRQECDARARRLDAPCRIEPWREQKAEMTRRDLLVLEPRDLDERRDARQCSRLHAGHALLDDAAVLPAQRHDVCDRAERDELEVIREGRLAVPQLPRPRSGKGLAELEGDADAREVLVGIRAVRAMRVEHRAGGRQLTARQMVVRDDDVELAGALYRRDVRD